LVAGMLVIGYVLYPVHILQVRDLAGNRILLNIPVAEGDQFGVSFINSVEKLPVTDIFSIDGNWRIIFSKIVYRAPYVGYINEEKAELNGRDLIISGINQPMDRVTFFNGYTTRHTLIFNNASFPIHAMAPGGALIEIAVRTEARLASLWKREKTL